ncbi:MAG: MBL fold metallo-hydrolase, partial [Candidatus Buchananbacteria bacterium]
MKISFFGAAGEVTGSCTLIETGQTKFLVDCGIFQGEAFSDQRNRNKFPFLVSEIDFVLLTHAHLDHCGRLPKLAKEAFKGSVYCTAATADFAEIMLLDSERVIAEEAQKLNQPPLYSQADVLKITKNLSPLEYGQEVKINQDIKIRCRDAGHILGSAIFEIWIKEDGQEKKLVFSGDLGNPPAPIVKDTELIDEADLVFVESTYGGIIHEPADERISKLRSAIIESAGQGGVLMIPAFALERTQEVLYELNELVENKEIPAMPIFVDSPLAIKATAVYKKYVEMYDDESKRLIASGDDLFNFPGLKYTPTVSDSKGINDVPGAKVILAGSGMCNGGRIPHHLKRYLSHKQNHLLIISYQAEGCLGRQLLDGAKKVLIEGEEVIVRAKVSAIGAYSSHADQPKLINWLKGFSKTKPKKVFIMHG